MNVTPLILTYNEEPNIERTLNSLRWAERVVVLDSGSTDATERIARSYANVRWCTRPFDNHKSQWRYGIHETGIETEYVLALDADFNVPDSFAKELEREFESGKWAGGLVSFDYCYYGRPLPGSLLPSQVRVFKLAAINIVQPGHTQVFSVEGDVYRFRARLIHDDRKPIERWVNAQLSYLMLNEKELSNKSTRLRDRLRRRGLMPPLMAALAYLRAGGPFGGAASARYAYERAICESLIAIKMMNARLTVDAKNGDSESDGKLHE